MKSPSPAADTPRKRWRRAILVTIATFAGIGSWLIADVVARRQLHQARAECVVAGLPTTWGELLSASSTAAEDGKSLLERARALIFDAPWASGGPRQHLQNLQHAWQNDSNRWWPPNAASLAEAHALLAHPAVVEATALVREASAHPHLNPVTSDASGAPNPAHSPPHLHLVSDSVDLLATSAVVAALAPETHAAATENILCALQLVALVQKATIDNPIRSAKYCTASLRRAVTRILESRGWIFETEAVVGSLEAAAEGFSVSTRGTIAAAHITGLERARADFLEKDLNWAFAITSITYDCPQWLELLDPIVSPVLRPRLAWDLCAAHEWLLASHQIATGADFATASAWRQLQQHIPRQEASFRRLIAFSALEQIYGGFHQQAELRMLALAVAAADHRRRIGAWPEALRELEVNPPTLNDPCSDTPFILRCRGDELAIIAYGLDGDDDGGRSIEPEPDLASSTDGPAIFDFTFDGDLVLHLRLPPRAP